MIRDERDRAVKGIRPVLSINSADSTLPEQFQTETLRPILKLQNSILLAQFTKYVQKFKPAFNAYNQNTQRNYIDEVLKRDPRIKNSLIASVVSMMTLEEYDYYCENKIEANKRIVTMLVGRLQSHLEMLY
ncbi:glyoxalase [Cryomorpha ignava]|uniref:Glyoxalase n=1 Tax=Cryomorpha ignava TaxID=101383 RepID=A0A7K3WMY8_9FLAO|nr:glyoxalase [Cryomorpha ignava]NEN22065.1 glyoxalase [Cryomorpha ignava]